MGTYCQRASVGHSRALAPVLPLCGPITLQSVHYFWQVAKPACSSCQLCLLGKRSNGYSRHFGTRSLPWPSTLKNTRQRHWRCGFRSWSLSLTSGKPLNLLGPQLSLLQNQVLVPDYGLARGREISSTQCRWITLKEIIRKDHILSRGKYKAVLKAKNLLPACARCSEGHRGPTPSVNLVNHPRKETLLLLLL